jgi:hypothetical protein
MQILRLASRLLTNSILQFALLSMAASVISLILFKGVLNVIRTEDID